MAPFGRGHSRADVTTLRERRAFSENLEIKAFSQQTPK
jgi:hypothetical protein